MIADQRLGKGLIKAHQGTIERQGMCRVHRRKAEAQQLQLGAQPAIDH